MSNQYHINENTGKVAKCHAQPGNCPITRQSGGEHYSNPEEAQSAYEKSQESSGNFLVSTTKSSITQTDSEDLKKIEFENRVEEFTRKISDATFYESSIKLDGIEYARPSLEDSEDYDDFDRTVLSSGLLDPIKGTRIVLEKDKYEESVTAYITDYSNGYTRIEGTRNTIDDYSKEDNVTAKTLLQASSLVKKQVPDLGKTNPQDVENYDKILKESLSKVSRTDEAAPLSLPGYVEEWTLDDSEYDKWNSKLPNNREISIQYSDNSYSKTKVLVEIEDYGVAHEVIFKGRPSFSKVMASLAQTMTFLDNNPEIAYEEEI